MKVTKITENAMVENGVSLTWVEVEVNGDFGCAYGSSVSEATVDALVYMGLDFDAAFDAAFDLIKTFKA
jgi:hypothetical protein